MFPHLPELAFFADEAGPIVDELVDLDLDTYAPTGAVEALAPKSRFGFRIVHQIAALDALLLLACVVEIGSSVESNRQPLRLARAFSYRFEVQEKSGQIFRPDRTFKDWLHRQKNILKRGRQFRTVVSTDISDYYARVNFHRLENLLDEVAPAHGAVRFIKRHIQIIRAKQSFGLPVGGSAARLLAELALSDTDQALRDEGLRSSRFVDDFRVFLTAENNPYDVLGFLAEQLGISEGLSLNTAKTSVVSRRKYLTFLEELTSDVEEEAEGIALDTLTARLYFGDEEDEEDLAKLKGINLVGLLRKEVDRDDWDLGRIRVIFRALRIARPTRAIGYLKDNFGKLTIFAKEVCLLMEALDDEHPGCFEKLADEIVKEVLSPPSSSVQLIRTWLLEIFVRGVVEISPQQVKQLDGMTGILDRRQLLLIRGRIGDRNYFRKQKTAIGSISELERAMLVWGASCLPKDEYEKWIKAVKQNFTRPLGKLFLGWLVKNRTSLETRLRATTVDHPV